DYKNIASNIMQGNSYEIDKIALSVLNRAIAIIEGFRLLFMQKNTYAAEHFIRIQLDSLVRFYSLPIYQDESYLQYCLDGKPINKFYDKNLRNEFTDTFLVKELSKIRSPVKELYYKYCGVIHFGLSHLNRSISYPQKDGVKYSVQVGDLDNYSITDRSILVSDMIYISIELFHIINSWLSHKKEELQ